MPLSLEMDLPCQRTTGSPTSTRTPPELSPCCSGLAPHRTRLEYDDRALDPALALALC